MRAATGWIFRGAAIIVALLATLQPVLGSFTFFRRGDPIEYETIHLVVGGILYNFTILLAVIALFTRLRHRWILFVTCLVQYGLTHLQLRLGLSANENVTLLAYHIPVGVLIFFISYVTVGLGFGLRFDTRTT